MNSGQKLYARAKQIIPGASQLLGKRSEMYLPEHWPAYYSRAKGCHVWDLDGKEYIDCTMVGIGTSVLGYADSDVEDAVLKAVKSGPMNTLNPPEDVELAELLLELHPWAEMVTYARTGGEMMAKAVRIARAATGREKIAFCGYHGWHDWYLAVNLGEDDSLRNHLLPGLLPAGVPKCLAGTMLPFGYNNIDELQTIFSAHGSDIAAVVMEPVRGDGPAPQFLQKVREISAEAGAVLLFDEITCGFRMNTGGMHQIYRVEPDLVAYAKTISNGFPMAALIGKRNVMDAAQNTFMSSAYWTERVGPTAAIATIKKHRQLDAGPKLTQIGNTIQQGWRQAAADAHIDITVSGIPPLSSFRFEHPDAPLLTTLFIQFMLDKQILASDRFYANLCHEPGIIERYLGAVADAFEFIAHQLSSGTITGALRGPIKHTGFARLV